MSLYKRETFHNNDVLLWFLTPLITLQIEPLHYKFIKTMQICLTAGYHFLLNLELFLQMDISIHLEVCYSLLFFEFVERVVCPVIIYKITFGYENIDIQFLQGDNCVDILLTSTTHNNGVIKLCKHNIVLRNSC